MTKLLEVLQLGVDEGGFDFGFGCRVLGLSSGVRAGLDFHHFVALNHPGRSAVENDCARSCGWQVVLNHLLRDEALPVLPVRWRVVQCVPTGEWLVWAGLIQGPAVVR